MALPKLNRLKKKKDFQGVFKKGKGFKEDFLFLKVLKRGSGLIRFGLIVTRKASKKASIRNKIKRRLSEVIRVRLPKTEKGWDGIFVISQPVAVERFKEIEEMVERLFKRAKLIQ